MSRNAATLKSSISRKPERQLRSVSAAKGIKQDVSHLTNRVRALKEMALSLLKEAQSLEYDILMTELATPQGTRPLDVEEGVKLDDAVRHFETNIIRQALLITGGNQARAARLLRVKANTLNYKVKLYNLY